MLANCSPVSRVGRALRRFRAGCGAACITCFTNKTPETDNVAEFMLFKINPVGFSDQLFFLTDH